MVFGPEPGVLGSFGVRWSRGRSWVLATALLLAPACVDRMPEQDLRILAAVPITRLSADLLWKEFQDNPDQARRTYWSKAIVVTGTMTKAGAGGANDRYLVFGQAGDQGVRAQLLDEQAGEILASAKNDPRVTLKCFCEGLSGDVVLKSCVRP
jgi:hypothetical protein